ncbi:DAHP synthetase [Meredithblackwellia eburnea MCA 4105]
MTEQKQQEWTPNSWRNNPVGQHFDYPQQTASNLAAVTHKLAKLPPIVSTTEIEKLKKHLKQVANGNAFLLQGGDCAELFDYCTSTKIESRLSLLLSMSLILIWGMKLPVVRIARMGGQYAKPRSSPNETLPDGTTVPSFRGDIVNGFSTKERTPDPERLLSAYFHSAATANHVRALLASGFASLPSAQGEQVPWSLPLQHVKSPELLEAYESIVSNLSDALEFINVVGAGTSSGGLESAEIFLSHEALLLEYETPLTRKLVIPAFARVPGGDTQGYYCTSAHFLWIGDRTRSVTGAHVEFFRGLRNPIGIKVGPSMAAEELVRLLGIVDPNKEPGRVTLISRYGADKVESLLPPHIRAVQASGHPVIWCCDPCHGNTKTAPSSNIKTRAMPDIVAELSSAVLVHAKEGSRLGGVHLELTGDLTDEGESVTECTGGSAWLAEEELGLRFESYCDPRLNFEQSLDVAFLLSSQYQALRRGRQPSATSTSVATSTNGSTTLPTPHENILAQLTTPRPSSVDSRAGSQSRTAK